MQPFSFFQRTGMLPQLAYSMHTVPQSSVDAALSTRTEVDDRYLSGTGANRDLLVKQLTDALLPILNANQDAIFERLTGLDASINALSQDLALFKHEVAQANEVNRATAQLLTERLDRLDRTIGVQTDSGNAQSLADRLDLHERLLERMNHSQAPALPVRYERATSTITLPASPRTEFSNTAIDLRATPTDSVNDNLRRRSICLRNSSLSLRMSPAFFTPQPELRQPADWSVEKDAGSPIQSDTAEAPEPPTAETEADAMPHASPRHPAIFLPDEPLAADGANEPPISSPRVTATSVAEQSAADVPLASPRADGQTAEQSHESRAESVSLAPSALSSSELTESQIDGSQSSPEHDFLADAMTEESEEPEEPSSCVGTGDQDEQTSFVPSDTQDSSAVSAESTTSHGFTAIFDYMTALATAPEYSAATSETSRTNQASMSPPHPSITQSTSAISSTSVPLITLQMGTSPENTKSYTMMSRELSPLSSVSSGMHSRTPSPPPKTVNPRLTFHSETGSTGTKKRKAKRKAVETPAKRPRKKASTKGNSLAGKMKWPKKSRGDEAFRKTFVRCDRCCSWYHCGCVGIAPGDVRLDPTEIYICPICEVSSHNVVVKKDDAPSQECARPDCDHTNQGEFFVERIVGRVPRQDRRLDDDRYTMVQKYQWLVKWDGYSIMKATWENEENMGDAESLVADFLKAAQEEGLDLNKEGIAVLWEAEQAGW